MKAINYIIIGLLFTLIFGCKTYDEKAPFEPEYYYETIMEYLNKDSLKRFTSFIKLIEADKLDGALTVYNNLDNNGNGGYTVFAPTNKAIDAYLSTPEAPYSNLTDLANSDFNTKFVRSHIVVNVYESRDFGGVLADTALASDAGYYKIDTVGQDKYYVENPITIISELDIKCLNGFIHVLEYPIEPTSLDAYEYFEENIEQYSIFKTLIDTTGFKAILQNDKLKYTIFAADDELFMRDSIVIYQSYYNTIITSEEEATPGFDVNNVYEENGVKYHKNKVIRSADDVIKIVAPTSDGPDDFMRLGDSLNFYVGNHIIKSSKTKNSFSNDNDTPQSYETYGLSPLSILYSDGGFQINRGVFVYDSLSSSYKDYISINHDYADIKTNYGMIHNLDEILFPYFTTPTTETFDPFRWNGVDQRIKEVIDEERTTEVITDLESLTVFKVSGVNQITVQREKRNQNYAHDDYVLLDGLFVINYEPYVKVLKGKYEVQVKCKYFGSQGHADISVWESGKKIGKTESLKTTTGDQTVDKVDWVSFGNVTIDSYRQVKLEIRAENSGEFYFDQIRLLYDTEN
ncbi:fasciclin domain-containing protein [Bacteroidales bacterium]|nr:fasciclin domain-containing protein [Bacteroidales bacterium]